VDVGAEPDHTDDMHTDAVDADFGVGPIQTAPRIMTLMRLSFQTDPPRFYPVPFGIWT
jgi:hypothetical protein